MSDQQINLNTSQSQVLRQEQILSQEQRLGLKILQKDSLELQQEISQRVMQNPMLVELQDPRLISETDYLEAVGMGTQDDRAHDEADFDQDLSEYREQCLVNAVEDGTPRMETPPEEVPEIGEEVAESPGTVESDGRIAGDTAYLDGAPVWTSEDEERRQHFLDSLTRAPGFLEVLQNECRCSVNGDEHFREICVKLCACINNSGYLVGTDEELCEATGATPEELAKAIGEIQKLDPPGIGARSLHECLLLQLRSMRLVGSLEWEMLEEHSAELAENQLSKIAKEMGCSLDEVQEALERIRQLNPYPGGELYSEAAQTIIPEVIIEKDAEGVLSVRYNTDAVPGVVLNGEYLRLLEETNDKETKSWLIEKRNDALMFMHALSLRQKTIEKVACAILSLQWRYFESGNRADLVPMKLESVADRIATLYSETKLSESTISRAIAGKYLRTPYGTFSFKDFFTTGVSSENGDVSNVKIRSRIREMVAGEDPRHPLIDQAISDQLRQEGYSVSRRTVTKYRELDDIPSTSQRKVHG